MRPPTLPAVSGHGQVHDDQDRDAGREGVSEQAVPQRPPADTGTNAAPNITKNPTAVRVEGCETVENANMPPRTNTTNPASASPMAFPMLEGRSPAPANFKAKYGRKMIGSQDMPTMAPPPPAAALKRVLASRRVHPLNAGW